MSQIDYIKNQSNEFDELRKLAKSFNDLPAVVDDDYPEMRQLYEYQMHHFIDALKKNRPNLFSSESDFASAVRIELVQARKKFPSSNCSFAALVEEVGELAQALLKVHAGKWPQSCIWDEAKQVGAMAERVAVEGDKSFSIGYSEP